MVLTDEEAALMPNCLAALNDWKVATTAVLRRIMKGMMDKID
jgi:hypothetical protein